MTVATCARCCRVRKKYERWKFCWQHVPNTLSPFASGADVHLVPLCPSCAPLGCPRCEAVQEAIP